MQGGPVSCPKHMRGGLGCEDRAKLTCLKGHSPSSAYPRAIPSCWGVVVLRTMSPQDLPRPHTKTGSIRVVLGGVIPPVVCWLLLSDPAGIDRSYSPGCRHGREFFWLTTKEIGHLCLEIYPKPQYAVASSLLKDSSAGSYKASIPSLEPSPAAF